MGFRRHEKSLVALSVFFQHPERWITGYDLIAAKPHQIFSASVYGILKRLHDLGYLEKRSEVGDPSKLGRPLRQLYRLTPIGVAEVGTMMNLRPDLVAPSPTRKAVPVGLFDHYDPNHDSYVVCHAVENMIPTYCAGCRRDVFMPVERLDEDANATPLCGGCGILHTQNKARIVAGLEPLPVPRHPEK